MFEIEFDPAKDAINRIKHGIGLAAATVILRGRHVRQRSVLPNDSGEERWLLSGASKAGFWFASTLCASVFIA